MFPAHVIREIRTFSTFFIILPFFAKMQVYATFQNYGNIMFSLDFFFYGELFSVVSRPICTKFGMNTCSYMQH
jgi:hypothetical protein